MPTPLPPLDHLRAFEAAGRLLSFKMAASELHVTPAAVGQRIRALEELLGAKLFLRKTRQVDLTDDGEALLRDVTEGLDAIRRGLAHLRNRGSDNVVVVSTTNTFSELCLLPHLPEFSRLHPDIDLRIVSTDERLNLVAGEADVGIRFGRGDYGGCESRVLAGDAYAPVCAPSLLDGDPAKVSLADICRLPLIETTWRVERQAAPSWSAWLAAQAAGTVPVTRRINVSVEAHAIHAALDGQGVALANLTFARGLIDSRRLVRLLGDEAKLVPAFRHHLVWPAHRSTKASRRFRDWIIDRFADHSPCSERLSSGA